MSSLNQVGYTTELSVGPDSIYNESSYIGAGAGPAYLASQVPIFQTGSTQLATYKNTEGHGNFVPICTLYVDSRDRARPQFPNPNNFSMPLASSLKKVRRIKLVGATIPILNDESDPPQPLHRYVAVVERHCYNAVNQPALSGQFPNGILAIIDLLPTSTNVPNVVHYKDDGPFDLGWVADFPQGLGSLNSLDIELWTWGWTTGPPGLPNPIPYPLLDEPLPVIPIDPVPPPAMTNNCTFTFKIFYEQQ